MSHSEKINQHKHLCAICSKEITNSLIGTHLRVHKISGENYYLKYFTQSGERPKCLMCDKKAEFLNSIKGYNPYCSKSCKYNDPILKEHRKTRFESNSLKKYGVKNPFQNITIKEKLKQTNLKKYGCENPSQCKEIKIKKEKTTFKNFGVLFPGQSAIVKGKAEQTNLQRYGVSNVMFNEEIAQRAMLNGGSRCISKQYTTKFEDKILVQGSYEKIFVDLCEKYNIKILNGPVLKYEFECKEKLYFTDFKILINENWYIIEVKSTYWFNQLKDQNEAKLNFLENLVIKNNEFKGYFLFLSAEKTTAKIIAQFENKLTRIINEN